MGGQPSDETRPDVAVEVSDWSMSRRQQERVAERLTPVLAELFGARANEVNVRFHAYPPTDFAVGGRLLSQRVPRAARIANKLLDGR